MTKKQLMYVLKTIKESNMKATTKSFLEEVLKAGSNNARVVDSGFTDEQIREMAGMPPASGTTFNTSPSAHTTQPPVDNRPPSVGGPKARRLAEGESGFTDEQIREMAGQGPRRSPNMVKEEDLQHLMNTRTSSGGLSQNDINAAERRLNPRQSQQSAMSSAFNSIINKLKSGNKGKNTGNTMQQPTKTPSNNPSSYNRRVTDSDLGGLTDEDIRRITGS